MLLRYSIGTGMSSKDKHLFKALEARISQAHKDQKITQQVLMEMLDGFLTKTGH